jgi:hypothetical protein
VLISFNFELTQLSLTSTLDWMSMVMSTGHVKSNSNIVFSPTNVGKCAKVLLDMMFGGMSESKTECSTLQKNIDHYCKAKIISMKTTTSIPIPCYDS